MRELFEEAVGQSPLDPNESARQSLRVVQRKRFYKSVGLTETPDGFSVTLDGRIIKTPAKRLLLVPSRAVAEGIAAEWEAQKEASDPTSMPLTRLAHSV